MKPLKIGRKVIYRKEKTYFVQETIHPHPPPLPLPLTNEIMVQGYKNGR